MTPGVIRIIKAQGNAIKCEAEAGKGGDHAGLIVLVNKDKDRIVLGRTDPTFKTASAAVASMKETVDVIRNGRPTPEKVIERGMPGSIVPPPKEEKPKPEKKVEAKTETKKPRKRKRKPRKRKGAGA